MTWLNSQFTFDDAVARGQPVWDLLITNWGYALDPDETCISFPATGLIALPTPSAIAIGPHSDIDRALVTWDMQKIVPSSSIWDYTRRLCVGAPLMYPQTGNRRPVDSFAQPNSGNVAILCSIFPSSSPQYQRPGVRDGVIYIDEYKKLDGTTGVFGPDAEVIRSGGEPNVPAYWLPPLLHVVFYIQPPKGMAPTKRFPLSINETLEGGDFASGEQLIAMIPIMGRKVVNIQMAADQDADMRVSVLRGINEQYPPQELTVFTAAAVPATTQVGATITDLYADFLLINSAPVVPANKHRITLNFTASDEI